MAARHAPAASSSLGSSLAQLQPAVARLAEQRSLQQLAGSGFSLQAGKLSLLIGHVCFVDMQSVQLLQQLLLDDSMSLLRQLLQIGAACLQQLAAQLGGDPAAADPSVMDVAAAFCTLLDRGIIRNSARAARNNDHTPSSPTDLAVLRLLQQELLPAYAIAARAAVRCLEQQQQQQLVQPPAGWQQSTDPSAAAAIKAADAVLGVWTAAKKLVPTRALLGPASLLADTAEPTAALVMALVRRHAAAGGRDAAAAMDRLLMLAMILVQEAVAVDSPAGLRNQAVLQHEAVLEVLLLGLAANTEHLHADCKGTSKQLLLKSLAAAASGSSSSGSGSSSSRSSSRQMRVPAHHEELLQALIGVRRLPATPSNGKFQALMQLQIRAPEMPLMAVWCAVRARVDGEQASDGEFAAWRLAAPLQLTLIELAALAPPGLTEDAGVLDMHLELVMELQRQLLGLHAHLESSQSQQQHQQPQPAAGLSTSRSSPGSATPSASSAGAGSAAAGAALAQRCLQALWLELGPVLLSLCPRRTGEAGEAGGEDADGSGGWLDSPSVLRSMFAAYSDSLLRAVVLNGQSYGYIVDLSAVVDSSPLLCSMIAEAALLAAPFLIRSPKCEWTLDARLAVTADSLGPIDELINCITDAAAQPPAASTCGTAAAAAAAAGASRGAQQQQPQHAELLHQQLLSVLAAALKHVAMAPPNGGSVESQQTVTINKQNLFVQKLRLLASIVAAALHVHRQGNGRRSTFLQACTAGSAAAEAAAATDGWIGSADQVASVALALQQATDGLARLTSAQQLQVFVLLARCLAAAGTLLQELPQHVTPAASFAYVGAKPEFVMLMFMQLLEVIDSILAATEKLQQMLQPGGAAAAAAAAGSEGVGVAAGAGLDGLLQQGLALPEALTKVISGFYAGMPGPAKLPPPVLTPAMAAATKALRAACQPRGGGLPQLLAGFGAACYAAFPQLRCCGNAACSSTDKFSEAALASRSCSACQAVKFCSRECLKAAWKAGHKAACPLLKEQRSGAASPAAADTPATASSGAAGGGSGSAAAGRLPRSAAEAGGLRVSELKALLGQLGVDGMGAVEKGELVQLVCAHLGL